MYHKQHGIEIYTCTRTYYYITFFSNGIAFIIFFSRQYCKTIITINVSSRQWVYWVTWTLHCCHSVLIIIEWELFVLVVYICLYTNLLGKLATDLVFYSVSLSEQKLDSYSCRNAAFMWCTQVDVLWRYIVVCCRIVMANRFVIVSIHYQV